jgi:hypothetical protein
MQPRTAAAGITVLRIDRTREPDEALYTFPSESDPPPAPLPGPGDLSLGEASKRESIERWGALGQDLRVLNGKVEALSATIRTLTYLTVGLVLITSLLLFVTLTHLTTSGANVWSLYADVAKWWR